MAETCRLDLLRSLEDRLGLEGFVRVAGVDEAGRGCLAGPVVVAAVIPDPAVAVPGVDDSKRLSPEARSRAADWIRRASIAHRVVAVPARWIDRVNILEATRLGMTRALAGLRPAADFAVVDAVRLANLPMPSLPLVRGDRISYSVACASILAKVERDRRMVELDRRYPQYGFASNKGYGAPGHLDALREFGPTPAHRLTFKSVLPRREVAWH
jgi:ribonuclease HII